MNQDADQVVCAASSRTNLSGDASGSAIFKVVPVKVWAHDPGDYVLTYAFIDEGSSVNMCSDRLAKRLGLSPSATNARLLTSNAVSVMDRKVSDLAIQGVNEVEAFKVKDAFVVDEVVDVSCSIPTDELIQGYSHLRSLNFPSLAEKNIDLLLGCDLHQAFLTKNMIVGDPGDPCGLHTALGWTIYGTDGGDQRLEEPSNLMVNFLSTENTDTSCERLLEILSQDFEDCDEGRNALALSHEDEHALFILNRSVKKVDSHYSVGLLWKGDATLLSDGRSLAETRLKYLKKKFQKDPVLFDRYSEKMSEYIDKYAERVSEELTSSGRIRYIPHHCIMGESKFRVVFDCSARCNGESLNDKLLRGPDLTNTVVGVLIRFRQHPIAVVADIKGMFSQVMVDENDRDSLRFLWYPDNDLTQNAITYRMRTNVFGAKSSPCCAAFALRRTASENVTGASQDVVDAVLRNIYVDDMCVSCITEKDASDLVTQLCPLLASGGFYLTKFLSNNRTVLEQLSPEDLAGHVNLSGKLPVHKTLGVFWDASSDLLKVKVNIKTKPNTRRGLLSMIGQTYDPLGIIQPFLLPARRLLQEACQSNLGWDQNISEIPGLEQGWDCWFGSLPKLEQVEVIRCILPDNNTKRVELHTFSDASTVGYGACSYLRSVCSDGVVYCNLNMGKSRVAPIKRISIPRLELVAAVLSARLSNLIKNELDLTIDEEYYWTDATVVLRYINNSSSRFEMFIANRVELLHTLTSVTQWRYVPTNENPADLSSRGIPPKMCCSADLWFKGPPFLFFNSEHWPEQLKFLSEWLNDDQEVEGMKQCCFQKFQKEDVVSRLFAHYSDFTRLQRAVAWMIRFIVFLRWKGKSCNQIPLTGPLTAAECCAAQETILRVTQVQSFAEVFAILPNQSEVSDPAFIVTEQMIKGSTALREIQSLSPFVVQGFLRVGGRLRNASLPYEAKFPLLLPHSHPVTDLLIKFHHEKEGHLGVNHVLADLNRTFWIVNGRSAIKRVLDGCIPCRVWKASAGRQQMGDLPPSRIQESHPFSNIGTDIMGPIMITVGRSRVKRYICIFNCLATRAVHLEVVPSLEADSFLQAFKRFSNRRNISPKTIYSDNGGNFVAAQRLLKGKIDWVFNPPRASHQGGFYEIFFKLFRKIFRSITSTCTLNEFDLFTYVVEIERILNNRPITKLPNSPDDWTALSPSAILSGSLADDVKFDSFMKADAYRHSWKKTEYLADKFWKQWLNQYLPLLQPKQKWFGSSPNMVPGDLVLMMDEATPRGQWPKAIVVENLPDKRGLVRRVRVRTADGSIFLRDIRKLCLLEGQLK